MYKCSQQEHELNSQSWQGDVQYDNNPSSICGLEISFSSVPQDIDIKLIPGNKFCNINNPGQYEERTALARFMYIVIFLDLITDSNGATLIASDS